MQTAIFLQSEIFHFKFIYTILRILTKLILTFLATLMKESYKDFINEIRKSGKILNDYFGKQIHIHQKSSDVDFRTAADVETEEAIIKSIEKFFPDYNIFGEEHGEINKGSEYTFIIDPLDGTNNFVLGIPVFTTNVALMKNDEIIFGVINNPVTNDIYYAAKGEGAFQNGTPIKVSEVDDETKITISYYCAYKTPKQRAAEFKSALQYIDVKRVLDLWCPGFCFTNLAVGNIQSIIVDDIELYDFAAGRIIATEAGAKICSMSGNEIKKDTESSFVISSNQKVNEFLVSTVTNKFI